MELSPPPSVSLEGEQLAPISQHHRTDTGTAGLINERSGVAVLHFDVVLIKATQNSRIAAVCRFFGVDLLVSG